MNSKDPWDWTNQKQAVPLVNTVAPVQSSQEQPPAAGRAGPGPTTQLINQIALTRGINAGEKGITNIWDQYKSAQQAGISDASKATGGLEQGSGLAAGSEASSVAVPEIAAVTPEVASVAPEIAATTAAPLSEAAIAGTTAAEAGALGAGTAEAIAAGTTAAETAAALGATAGTTAATTGALGAGAAGAAGAGAAGAAGTVAATNAWNPIGWAAMAYLGGKALKLW